VLFSISPPASASPLVPGANPASNVAPSPDFLAPGTCSKLLGEWSCANPCVTARLTMPEFTESVTCTSYVLGAIDAARKAEKVGPMRLPSNWSRLTPPEQLFVLCDLERTALGLPPYLGLNAALSADAQVAATTDSDPTLAPGFAVGVDPEGYYGMGSTWSTGFSPLVADYFWMYSDGWGGSRDATTNLACTSPGAAGCWAHRDELLGYDPRYNPGVGLWCTDCEMGTGFSMTSHYPSMTDLIELPANKPPAMTFTWARDVRPFLPRPSSTAPHHRVVFTQALHSGWTLRSPASRTCPTSRIPTPHLRPACHRVLHQPGKSLR
jgi:hypothetical protein